MLQRYHVNGTFEKNVSIDSTNINYAKLKGNKYKVTDVNKDKLWINVEDRRIGFTQRGSLNG